MNYENVKCKLQILYAYYENYRAELDMLFLLKLHLDPYAKFV